jgi:hypothetical protein
VGGTQSAAAVAPPGSQVGTAGFPTMPFNFNFDGDFFSIERFLSAIERYTTTSGDDDITVRGRLLTVDGVAIVESPKGGFPDVQAGFGATAYLLPPDEGLTGGATAWSPAAGGAGSTASSGTSATPTNAGVSP